MVTVTGYKVRQNKSGQNFIALELTGSLEIVQSQSTGNMYATVRNCSMPSTFDEGIAKMMVGSQLEGEIVRVSSDPYEYTNKRTGEVITLAYSYAYKPNGSIELLGSGKVEDIEPETMQTAITNQVNKVKKQKKSFRETANDLLKQ